MNPERIKNAKNAENIKIDEIPENRKSVENAEIGENVGTTEIGESMKRMKCDENVETTEIDEKTENPKTPENTEAGLERLLESVIRGYGFSQGKLLERFHRESARLVCKVAADDKILLVRGLPATASRETVEGNVAAHEYLGNQRQMAPRILHMPDGAGYVQKQGYWFYVLEYVEGENVEESVTDERELGRLLRKLHSLTDYARPSGLSDDKTEFYGWFTEKEFKREFDGILDGLPDFRKRDRCFIHSDMGPHNSLRTPEGDMILIDLDDAGIGSRYLDLGWPFIMQFVKHDRATGKMDYRMDLAEAFLAGYYGEDEITRQELDLIWQGAVFMHISYMNDYGPEAVDSLWKILKFGMAQKERLWRILCNNPMHIRKQQRKRHMA